MLEQCLTLDAHLIEDHRRTELSDDNDELSRKFLANISVESFTGCRR